MKYLVFSIIIMGITASCKLMPKKDGKVIKKTNSTAMSKGFRAPEWARTTNIYEVNLRQYTVEGNFNAFAKHLPRLRDMGVETLWFMPIQPVGKLNRKGILGSYYSISDYVAVNPEFGTLDDFKTLVKQAQGLGFKVIIDWVANHTSWDHSWTRSNAEYFTRDSSGNFMPPVADWADVIDLNYENTNMRRAMIDAMKFWVNETGIDGFRCDMAHMVPLDFWKDARKELDAIRPLFWLGETEEPKYHEAFDASYTWEFLHKMEDYWKKKTLISGLDSVLHKYETAFPASAMRLYFTSNHDENSHSGTEYERMGDAALPFAVFCATWEGIPLIYSGQELPLRKRLAFFEKDTITWNTNSELHDFYKILLQLRSTNPALRADSTVRTSRVKTTADDRIFSFLRKNGNSELLIILNLSSSPVSLQLMGEQVRGQYRNVFTAEIKDASASKAFDIREWEYLVFVK